MTTHESEWQKCWAIAQRINGWLTVREARLLFECARRAPADATIVEIGSFFGRSTVCLAHGSRAGHGARIAAIDPHIGSPKHEEQMGCDDTWPWFLDNLEAAGVRDLVTPIKKPSVDAIDDVEGDVGFLFIDGSHDEDDVAADFDTWFPRVRGGCDIAFHDSWHMTGVRRVSGRILRASTEIAEPRLVDTITLFRKLRSDERASRMRNRGFDAVRAVRGLAGFLRLTYRGTHMRDARLQPGGEVRARQT